MLYGRSQIKRRKMIKRRIKVLKVVTSEQIGGSGVISTLGTWYGGVVRAFFCTLMRPPSCIEISIVRHHKSKI